MKMSVVAVMMWEKEASGEAGGVTSADPQGMESGQAVAPFASYFRDRNSITIFRSTCLISNRWKHQGIQMEILALFYGDVVVYCMVVMHMRPSFEECCAKVHNSDAESNCTNVLGSLFRDLT